MVCWIVSGGGVLTDDCVCVCVCVCVCEVRGGTQSCSNPEGFYSTWDRPWVNTHIPPPHRRVWRSTALTGSNLFPCQFMHMNVSPGKCHPNQRWLFRGQFCRMNVQYNGKYDQLKNWNAFAIYIHNTFFSKHKVEVLLFVALINNNNDHFRTGFKTLAHLKLLKIRLAWCRKLTLLVEPKLLYWFFIY